MVNSSPRLVSLFALTEKNLSREIGFHGKISCCLPDNEYYDYTDHSKAKNQDTDLLTGFLLMKEEKKQKTH